MPENDKVLLFLLRMSGLEMGWLRYFFAALNATAISRVALEGFFKVGNISLWKHLHMTSDFKVGR